jgi:hypothetical protein
MGADMLWKRTVNDKLTRYTANSPCANGVLTFYIDHWPAALVADLWCEQIRGWRLSETDSTRGWLTRLEEKAAVWAKALRRSRLNRDHDDLVSGAFRAARRIVIREEQKR